MSPSEFTFKLTVPTDPEGASVVAVVATHAVEYTNIDKAAGEAFVARVRDFAAAALKGSTGTLGQAVCAAANGHLTVTMGKESVSQALPS
jgi:hypothetical protein